MQQIELDDQTARNSAAQAAARGMTIIQYLQALAPQVPISDQSESVTTATELDAELEALALELPTLPRDFSRADIYDEHGRATLLYDAARNISGVINALNLRTTATWLLNQIQKGHQEVASRAGEISARQNQNAGEEMKPAGRPGDGNTNRH